MSDTPLQVLHDRFGLKAFRPGQERVITTLLEGRPSLAVFPTGGGKSLCYQLPAVLLPGLTLVVSPLIAEFDTRFLSQVVEPLQDECGL